MTINVHIHADPTPQPMINFVERWNTSIVSANRWASRGKIPGVFRGPDGKWWVQPLQLWNWVPPADEAETTPEGDGINNEGEGSLLLETQDRWTQRIERPV